MIHDLERTKLQLYGYYDYKVVESLIRVNNHSLRTFLAEKLLERATDLRLRPDPHSKERIKSSFPFRKDKGILNGFGRYIVEAVTNPEFNKVGILFELYYSSVLNEYLKDTGYTVQLSHVDQDMGNFKPHIDVLVLQEDIPIVGIQLKVGDKKRPWIQETEELSCFSVGITGSELRQNPFNSIFGLIRAANTNEYIESEASLNGPDILDQLVFTLQQRGKLGEPQSRVTEDKCIEFLSNVSYLLPTKE